MGYLFSQFLVAFFLVFSISSKADLKRSSKNSENLTVYPSSPSQNKLSKKNHTARSHTFVSTKANDYAYILGEISSLEGKSGKAISHFKQILKSQIKSPLRLRLAWEYLNQGLVYEAQKECEKFISFSYQHEKGLLKAYMMLAGIYTASNQLDKALEQYEKVFQIEPLYLEARMNQALLLEELQKKAPSYVLNLLDQEPHFHQKRGDIYLIKGEEKKAIKSFKKALNLDSSQRAAALRLFQIYGYKNQYSSMTSFMENTTFQDIYIASLMVRAYLKQGKKEKAFEKLENLLLDHPLVQNLRDDLIIYNI